MNAHATPEIGHNNPPRDSILEARDAFEGLSRYLKNHPVVQSHDEAKTAKTYLDAGKDVLKKLEADRDSVVRPINENVKNINNHFKEAREPLEKLVKEVTSRLDRYLEEEERRRKAELEKARAEAAEKERLAREAEAKEREAIENAAEGEFTDVGEATAEADAAFAEFRSADRAAHIAARDSKVRINDGLGIGRALSRRTTETLEVTDALAAVKAILEDRAGFLPDKLNDAILSAARDYRKAKGVLLPGVVSHKGRSL